MNLERGKDCLDMAVSKLFCQGLDIKYFSLLRGLSEMSIAKLFSNYKQYHYKYKPIVLNLKISF